MQILFFNFSTIFHFLLSDSPLCKKKKLFIKKLSNISIVKGKVVMQIEGQDRQIILLSGVFSLDIFIVLMAMWKVMKCLGS